MVDCVRRVVVYSAPGRYGSWTSNRIGQRVNNAKRPCSSDSVTQGRREIFLPNLRAFERPKIRSKAWRSKARKLKRRRDDSEANHITGESRLLSLPNELLLQILDSLIRTGGIYHFTPKHTRDKHYSSIHYFSDLSLLLPSEIPDSDTPPTSYLSAKPNMAFQLDPPQTLALVCQRFKDVVYSLFYGQNQFVIEMTGNDMPLTLLVNVSSLVPHELHQNAHDICYQSWNRLFTRGSESLSSPLTIRTMSYLTSLTLCVNLLATKRCDEEKEDVRKQISAIAACFTNGKGAHCVKRLSVSLDVVDSPDRPFSRQLSLVRVVRSGAIEMTIDDTVPVADGREALASYSTRYPSTCDALALEDVLAPLLNVRGIQEVVTKRLVSPSFGEELRKQALRPGEFGSRAPLKDTVGGLRSGKRRRIE